MERPAWLKDTPTLNLLNEVGLAIRAVRPGSLHCGLLYRSMDKDIHLLHLAFHHQLENDSDVVGYAWVQLELPRLRLPSVAAYCERIWRAHQDGRVPYGMRFEASTFGPQGELLLGPTEHGLTCATFILAALRGASIELLSIAEWTPRPEDKELHALILHILASRQQEVATAEQQKSLADHSQAIREEEGCARFRPEEVVSAGHCFSRPVSFADASRMGQALALALSP